MLHGLGKAFPVYIASAYKQKRTSRAVGRTFTPEPPSRRVCIYNFFGTKKTNFPATWPPKIRPSRVTRLNEKISPLITPTKNFAIRRGAFFYFKASSFFFFLFGMRERKKFFPSAALFRALARAFLVARRRPLRKLAKKKFFRFIYMNLGLVKSLMC